MLTISKYYLSVPLLLTIVIFISGCGSPSDNQIKSLISLPSGCVEPIEFKEITVGSKQTIESEDYSGTMSRVEWYPVRVIFVAKCLTNQSVQSDEIPLEAAFDDEAMEKWKAEQKNAIKRDGIETTLRREYRFSKNEYGEWVAIERNR